MQGDAKAGSVAAERKEPRPTETTNESGGAGGAAQQKVPDRRLQGQNRSGGMRDRTGAEACGRREGGEAGKARA